MIFFSHERIAKKKFRTTPNLALSNWILFVETDENCSE